MGRRGYTISNDIRAYFTSWLMAGWFNEISDRIKFNVRRHGYTSLNCIDKKWGGFGEILTVFFCINNAMMIFFDYKEDEIY